jgi:hypothetical protein
MIRVSLTDFVDIVSKSGTPKATKVAQVKKRGRYEPAVDFYKPLREKAQRGQPLTSDIYTARGIQTKRINGQSDVRGTHCPCQWLPLPWLTD